MDTELPPGGLTWGEYIAMWVADRGGWLPLADELIHRAGDRLEVPQDPQTVERGLRRLARRDQLPGGQYGRWMLRLFGFTSPVEHWVKWLGKYHGRFADLPAALRLEQLALWNRPPIAESPLQCWIEAGIASAYFSQLDLAACELWLARAERHAEAAGRAAEIEVALLRAELVMERDERAAAEQRYVEVERALAAGGLTILEDECYRARLAHGRATLLTRAGKPSRDEVERAHAYYAAIPDSAIPFVAFRKAVGLAYCAWQLGDAERAIALARRAVEEAGDGGLVRMRVMALNMLSRVLPPDEARVVNERARKMATMLRDEDLLRRVAHCAPPA